MPTKSNNIGGRGGRRSGAGRPKKNKSIGETINKSTDKAVESIPKQHDLLSTPQKVGGELQASAIYAETYEYLTGTGCISLISSQLIEQYAMNVARWIQCENMISKNGFMGKHPTTGAPVPSPYVGIATNYQSQARQTWAEISAIVRNNSSADISATKPQDDMMERLLSQRS